MSITTNPDAVERARSLQSLADDQAGASEALGQLTQDLDDALHEQGLYGMWVPKSLGGLELDPISSLEVIEAVSYGQPSAGWVLMAAALSVGTGAAYLSDEAADQLFTGERFTIIAGQGTRPGTARKVEGGLEISGSWSFASGIKHATHLHTAAQDTETGQPRFFIVPVEQVTFDQGSWDVMGLRGTGSIDYTLQDVFVPANHSYYTLTTEPVTGGDLYRIGIGNYASLNHGPWALGTGRRLL
ncbi:MAG: hypothetical protein QOG77_977, partial [Solirubrobacteraceae bacterium]|nr:hypothetical protein [Solirubrobacteraceae bacterium]